MTAKEGSRGAWWWLFPALLLGLGFVVAQGWYVNDGCGAAGHADHATIPVPADQVVHLPAEDVRLFFQAYVPPGTVPNITVDVPEGLEVNVRRASGGRPLAITRISDDSVVGSTNNTSWAPYGKLTVPEEGDYLITSTDPSIDRDFRRPEITLGSKPWNPFGPPIVGALIWGLPFLLAAGYVAFGMRPD